MEALEVFQAEQALEEPLRTGLPITVESERRTVVKVIVPRLELNRRLF